MRLSRPFFFSAQSAAVLAVFFVGTSIGFTVEPEHQHTTQEDMEKVIAAQQQLNLQKKESEAKMRLLQELRQEALNLNAVDEEAATAEELQPLSDLAQAAGTLPETPKVKVGEQHEVKPDWPGSSSLFGSKTQFAVGGFVKLDLIHDTDAINTRCDFVTSAIPTNGGTMVEGADGQTSFCVNATRLTFESRTPTTPGRFKIYLSVTSLVTSIR